MTLNPEQLEDKLEHARANYWILTVLCGTFLALTLNKVRLFEFDGVAALYASLLVIIGYFTLKLSEHIKQLKAQRE
ncbi:hypothetical protein PTW35_26685 (plasmid) [Photobacterium sp. DA100]|uniref:hypothetical protein n=1 Tax=Photobacterium sp. DA100 TaxID=3027472 RepID=UPI00247ABD70|nr:hypothetical protein [Photobacterium sp. DA100]WEM44840.1 hypothetical protein PTW35_26685 [Photobacterium sp. DA100]